MGEVRLPFDIAARAKGFDLVEIHVGVPAVAGRAGFHVQGVADTAEIMQLVRQLTAVCVEAMKAPR